MAVPKEAVRPRIQKPAPPERIGNYFLSPAGALQFISSGCQVLDCAIGGGYPLGRIVNIIGDKSTGKTLLAIEAIANFYMRYPNGHAWYCETEAAFDEDYAKALGINFKRVLRPKNHVRTVEQFFDHLQTAISNRGDLPGLYVLDSLDALSDDAEMAREIGKESFGAQKAKKLSEAFRRVVQTIEQGHVCVIIISQIRDNITATFGRKYVRSGGKALDFYASQILYLAQIGKISKQSQKIERTVGVRVRAKVDKNKIGLPYRECEFGIRFGFGVDDVAANIEWLKENERLDDMPSLNGRNIKVLLGKLDDMPRRDYNQLRKESQQALIKAWSAVETRFVPKSPKYEDRE